MNIIKRVEEISKKHFDKIGAHDFTHTKRVLKNAEQIAKNEKNVDLDILRVACLLHDIARKKEEEGKCECHAKEGANMAKEILEKTKFSKDKIKIVVDAINCHRKSKGLVAKTIESKILQDADRLDIFGAIGIARTIAHHAKSMIIHSDSSRKLTSFEDYNTNSLFEYIRSLLLVKNNYLNTKTARSMLADRLKFIRLFVRQFEKEWI